MFEVTQLRRADLGLKFRVCDKSESGLFSDILLFSRGYDFHGHSQRAEAVEIRKERAKGCSYSGLQPICFTEISSSCKY